MALQEVRAATPHSRAVSCVRFSPRRDGRAALPVLARHNLCPGVLRGHTDGVSDLSWSTEWYYLCSASASDDRTLRIWDIRPIPVGGAQAAAADPGAERCVRVLKGHTNFVFRANFNLHTSSQIASGGFECTVRIWKSGTADCTHVIDVHSEPVTSVHFIRYGSIIVSESMGAVRFGTSPEPKAEPARACGCGEAAGPGRASGGSLLLREEDDGAALLSCDDGDDDGGSDKSD